LARLRQSWWPIAQAALAAAVAWFIADHVVHHRQPFFAPIAAAITMSTTRVRRSARIVQMVVGVLLGIAIGEGLGATLGTSAIALGVIVFAAFAVAVMSGIGFVGEGILFANQTAASAILVVTLSQHGAGGARAADALVGGVVAMFFAVLVFPTEPLSLLADAERRVLLSLADTLRAVAGFLAAGAKPSPGWLQARRSDAHTQLALLDSSVVTARTSVRIAPLRWRLRSVVASEISWLNQIDALVDSAIGLARAATRAPGTGGAPPEALQRAIGLLADALSRLASTKQPWPAQLLQEVQAATDHATSQVANQAPDRALAAGALLDATAADLGALTGAAHDPR
jgi:uncharacterized membrane protein YgaE (UPF0421/DUF939 family)